MLCHYPTLPCFASPRQYPAVHCRCKTQLRHAHALRHNAPLCPHKAAPSVTSAALLTAMPLPHLALPRHDTAVPYYAIAKLGYTVPLPNSALPCHCHTLLGNTEASRCYAIPLQRRALPMRRYTMPLLSQAMPKPGWLYRCGGGGLGQPGQGKVELTVAAIAPLADALASAIAQ